MLKRWNKPARVFSALLCLTMFVAGCKEEAIKAPPDDLRPAPGPAGLSRSSSSKPAKTKTAPIPP